MSHMQHRYLYQINWGWGEFFLIEQDIGLLYTTQGLEFLHTIDYLLFMKYVI